ncbi:MAG: GNAT family N-acetyltransferase [Acidimicrobiales bacterium]
MGSTESVVEVATITAEQTRPLRHLILRPTQPAENTEYPGDHDPDTRHLGAFDQRRLVGIASLYKEPRIDGLADGWRLRGMATATEARRRGAGRALLGACRDHVAVAGGGELWCNARIAAVEFYVTAGFEAVGDEFDVEDIGPHVVMRTGVAPAV